MAKTIKKPVTPESFIAVCYGLKDVQTAGDVDDNLEQYICCHFTIPQRIEILTAIQKTKEEYYDRLHTGMYDNGFDLDVFLKYYENPKAFKKWRMKLDGWIHTSINPDFTRQILDTYFQSQMMDDLDLRAEVLEAKWSYEILPLLQN